MWLVKGFTGRAKNAGRAFAWCVMFALGASLVGTAFEKLQAAVSTNCTCENVGPGVNFAWQCITGGSFTFTIDSGGSLTCTDENGNTTAPICTVGNWGGGFSYTCAAAACDGQCQWIVQNGGWVPGSNNCHGVNLGLLNCECCAPTVSAAGLDNGFSITSNCSTSCTTVTPPPPGYSCSGAPNYTCAQDPNSTQSQADCVAGCHAPLGFNCVDGSCVQAAGGTYSDMASCITACQQSYNCVNNACQQVQSGGSYPTLQACQAACGGGYTCDNNTCTYHQGSQYTQTLSQCQQNCGMYMCDRGSGSCVQNYQGTQTLAACQASCTPGYSCDRQSGQAPQCVLDTSSTTTLTQCELGCQCDGSCMWTYTNCPVCHGEVVWIVQNASWVQKINNCDRGCTAPAPYSDPSTHPEGWEDITVCAGTPLDQNGGNWQMTDSSCVGTTVDPTQVCGCVAPTAPASCGATVSTYCSPVPRSGRNCVGTKTFHPRETDNDPTADQDGDGDNNFLTVMVTNGDSDGDGCCDFEESFQGLYDPKIGCCYCDIWSEWWKAGGYVLTDRMDVRLRMGRLLLPGDRGSRATSPVGMLTEIDMSLQVLPQQAPDGTYFPPFRIWIPLTVESFANMYAVASVASSQPVNTGSWQTFITNWNILKNYIRTASLFIMTLYFVGLAFKETRV